MGRRAYTLVELLVVLAIIAMVMALAMPYVSGMMRTTKIAAAVDMLRAAVSKTRSTAISTRRGCSLDISHTEAEGVTERMTSSVMLLAEDFERYPDFLEYRLGPDKEALEDVNKYWAFHPKIQELSKTNVWQIVTGQTRELRAGLDSGTVTNAYAWALDTVTPEKPEIDIERTIQARFRMRRVNPEQPRGTWGFGLVAHFVRDKKQLLGYRFCVQAQSTDSGWNISSEAVLQKIYNPSNPNAERSYDAETPGKSGKRLLDQPRLTAVLAPNVWYRAKMYVKRESKIVQLAGKVWVDGSPEPQEWMAGPAYDFFEGADVPPGITDSFKQGGNALSGGYAGVWVGGGEFVIDDFTVDTRETWLLPGGIQIRAKRIERDSNGNVTNIVDLKPYEPGGFPLVYRPDGTAAVQRTVYVCITDVASGNFRYIRIDPNTGRVENVDDLSEKT